MKEDNPLWQIYCKSLPETYERFCEISEIQDSTRNVTLAQVWKKLEEHGVNTEKKQEIQELLFMADWVIFLNHIQIHVHEETAKLSMETTFRCVEEYKQAIEDFLHRTKSIPEPIARNAVKDLLIQEQKRLQTAEKAAVLQQEFLNLLDEKKSELGVEPYRGRGAESMMLFRHLIGKLGELLNTHFKGNPGVTTPRLIWPCAEAVAELLNGYFVNLEVNFNADQVRKRFDSYILIEKK